jgi:hypothetical protein
MTAPAGAAASKLAAVPVERRERRPVTMLGYAMRADQSTVEVMVVDLSYEGCGVETPTQFDAGEALKLSVLRRGAIECRVRWCSNGKAGLIFEPETKKVAAQRARQSERVPIEGEVSLRRIGQINYRVRLFDCSPEGCKTELVERPRIGEHVLVKMPHLESLDAEVCWVDNFTAGLRFEKPLHPAVFDLMGQRREA